MTNNEGLANVRLHLVDSTAKAVEFLTWLGERRPEDLVSVDLETGEFPGNDTKHALSPWHGKLRLAQVGDGEQGWSIPWEQWSGVFLEGMSQYDGLVACHNIAFEAKWLSQHSKWTIPWHKAHDTMIMSQVLSPNEPAALKTLTAKYIDPMAAALQSGLDDAKTKNGWTWGTIPTDFPIYWQYGALDTVLTSRLMLDVYWDQVKPGAQYSAPYELEMNARRIATTMEINGARIDVEYSEQQHERLLDYVEQVQKWGMDNYHVSFKSPIQLVGMFEKIGATLTKTTPSGAKSMDQDVLDMLAEDGSDEVKYVASQIVAQRKAAKLASSYFENFINHNVDGLLHPEIKTLGARTGRMSIVNPALQTLPSGDALVRNAFIPRNEGEGIVSSDLDQVEFRLTANMSEDKALIELFHEADRTGGDVFTSIMRQVYQDDTLTKEDKRRKLIKGVVYGKLYGAGVDKMAATAGVSSAQMAEVVQAFDGNYPGVKKFQRAVEGMGQHRLDNEGTAYVNTRTGRRLPADGDRVYSLTNYLIQATAAEVFKQNLVDLDAAGLTDYMVVPVHDEIVLSVPLAEAHEIMPVVKEAMTTEKDWDIPLTSGVEGPFPRWGSKYEGDH